MVHSDMKNQTSAWEKFIHVFGFHKWGRWQDVTYTCTSLFYKGEREGTGQIRTCEICGEMKRNF